MEAQKTLNSQSNLEQKEQCWKYLNIGLQIILQSHIGTKTDIKTRIEDLEIKPQRHNHLIF
jgi:hypothetical protein